MGEGVTIRIFLVDGRPQGPRLIERMGWTGSMLVFPRVDYTLVRSRPEADRTGVYILSGPVSEGRHRLRVYIGEADELRSRVDSHHRSKDFWTSALLLTTKDDSLNKAHVRYLEARLLGIARDADVVQLDNSTAHAPVPLSEPETAEMETFLSFARPLFELAGVSAFDPPESRTEMNRAQEGGAAPPTRASPPRLYLRTQKTRAEGEEQETGFLVFAGSVGRRETRQMMGGYAALRKRLLDDGTLEFVADHVNLTRNHLFDSPSAAASVLSGGHKNGRSEWKDASGRSLKLLQQESVK